MRHLVSPRWCCERLRRQTCSLSCGTGDQTENEKHDFHAALAILPSIANGDAEDDAFEEVTIEAR